MRDVLRELLGLGLSDLVSPEELKILHLFSPRCNQKEDDLKNESDCMLYYFLYIYKYLFSLRIKKVGS